MILNCDIGERGADHPVDVELMSWIGQANLACGGHAGDPVTVRAFRERARTRGVVVAAHLSYPDREGFGRVSLSLPWHQLRDALEAQWALVSDLERVKFHGALYNDSVVDAQLAGRLAGWLREKGVVDLVCPPESEMARAGVAAGLDVLAEAFVERRYTRDPAGRLVLAPRSRPGASILDVGEALDQARRFIYRGVVTTLERETTRLAADTLCIHSDSPLALDLAREVAALLEGMA